MRLLYRLNRPLRRGRCIAALFGVGDAGLGFGLGLGYELGYRRGDREGDHGEPNETAHREAALLARNVVAAVIVIGRLVLPARLNESGDGVEDVRSGQDACEQPSIQRNLIRFPDEDETLMAQG